METVTSADGTTIAYERSGEGPPLVMVTGAMSDRRSQRSPAALLARHFTIYLYDRRGRGGSGDTPPYAPAREVEDLGAVIGAAGGSAAVFGHSSGAVLALEAAAAGLPITRLAAYEPPYIVEGTRPRPYGVGERVGELISAGHRGEAITVFMVEAVQTPAGEVAKMAASGFWPELEALAHTLPYDLALCGDYRVPVGRLQKVQVTTLMLDGGDSPDWAHASVREVAGILPDSRHVTLEGQSHGATDEVLVPVLVDFFSR